jgi:hypothetical protein
MAREDYFKIPTADELITQAVNSSLAYTQKLVNKIAYRESPESKSLKQEYKSLLSAARASSETILAQQSVLDEVIDSNEKIAESFKALESLKNIDIVKGSISDLNKGSQQYSDALSTLSKESRESIMSIFNDFNILTESELRKVSKIRNAGQFEKEIKSILAAADPADISREQSININNLLEVFKTSTAQDIAIKKEMRKDEAKKTKIIEAEAKNKKEPISVGKAIQSTGSLLSSATEIMLLGAILIPIIVKTVKQIVNELFDKDKISSGKNGVIGSGIGFAASKAISPVLKAAEVVSDGGKGSMLGKAASWVSKSIPGAGTVMKGIAKLGGIAGALITFALEFIDAYTQTGDVKESIKHALAVSGGSALGAMAGAGVGAAVGTTILPGVGTAVGSVVGAVAGGYGGGAIAGKVMPVEEKSNLLEKEKAERSREASRNKQASSQQVSSSQGGNNGLIVNYNGSPKDRTLDPMAKSSKTSGGYQ